MIQSKGEWRKGDWRKGDWRKGDWGKGDWGKGDWGEGDVSYAQSWYKTPFNILEIISVANYLTYLEYDLKPLLLYLVRQDKRRTSPTYLNPVFANT